MQRLPFFHAVLAICLFLFGSAAHAQETALEAKGEWDELSLEVVPQIVERNGDLGSIIRDVKRVSCQIDWKLTSNTFPRPILAALSYGWDDRNEDGILTQNEIRIDVLRAPGRGTAAAMEEVKKGLEAQTLMSTFNLFPLNNVRTERRGDGYLMRLEPASTNFAKRVGYQRLQLTVSGDFRVTAALVTSADGTETRVKATYQQILGRWYPVSEVKERHSEEGSLVREEKSVVFSVKDGIPLVEQVNIHQVMYTTQGPITFNSTFTLSNWKVEKRAAPLSPPAPQPVTPPVPPPVTPPPQVPPPQVSPPVVPENPLGGAGRQDEGGLFEPMEEEDPGATADTNPGRALAAELIRKLKQSYYTFEGRFPGVHYEADCELQDVDGVIITPVTLKQPGYFKPKLRRGNADRWCTKASRPMSVFNEQIIYRAMGTYPGIAEPGGYTARVDGDEHLLMGSENGNLVERTRIAADGTIEETEEWFHEGDQCRFMFRHTYVVGEIDGTKYIRSVQTDMFNGQSMALMKRSKCSFSYTRTQGRVFLLHLTMSSGVEQVTFALKEVRFSGGEPPEVAAPQPDPPDTAEPEDAAAALELADRLLTKIEERYYTWAYHSGMRATFRYQVKDAEGKKAGTIRVVGGHVDMDYQDPFPTKDVALGVAAIEGMKWFFSDPLHSVSRDATPDYMAKKEGDRTYLIAKQGGVLLDLIELDKDLVITGRRETIEGEDLCPQYGYRIHEERGFLLIDQVEVGFCPAGSSTPIAAYQYAFRYGRREGVTVLERADVSLGAQRLSVELVSMTKD